MCVRCRSCRSGHLSLSHTVCFLPVPLTPGWHASDSRWAFPPGFALVRLGEKAVAVPALPPAPKPAGAPPWGLFLEVAVGEGRNTKAQMKPEPSCWPAESGRGWEYTAHLLQGSGAGLCGGISGCKTFGHQPASWDAFAPEPARVAFSPEAGPTAAAAEGPEQPVQQLFGSVQVRPRKERFEGVMETATLPPWTWHYFLFSTAHELRADHLLTNQIIRHFT